MKIYAAVIEWPEAFADAGPSLIIEKSPEARAAMICAEILETANALTEPDWRDAIAATGSNEWAEWCVALEDVYLGNPWVTEYEREV